MRQRILKQPGDLSIRSYINIFRRRNFRLARRVVAKSAYSVSACGESSIRSLAPPSPAKAKDRFCGDPSRMTMPGSKQPGDLSIRSYINIFRRRNFRLARRVVAKSAYSVSACGESSIRSLAPPSPAKAKDRFCGDPSRMTMPGSKQPGDLSIRSYINIFRRRNFRQARHGHDVAGEGHDEAGAG